MPVTWEDKAAIIIHLCMSRNSCYGNEFDVTSAIMADFNLPFLFCMHTIVQLREEPNPGKKRLCATGSLVDYAARDRCLWASSFFSENAHAFRVPVNWETHFPSFNPGFVIHASLVVCQRYVNKIYKNPLQIPVFFLLLHVFKCLTHPVLGGF